MIRKRKVWHNIDIKTCFSELNSSADGLSDAEANQRLLKHGKNLLPAKKSGGPLLVFLKQFNSFFVYILIIATLISFLIKNFIDAYVILAIIMINSSIGFFQEYKAEKSIEALKKMVKQYAKVMRDGDLEKISAKNLVPGDIVLLESGDKIPADIRIIESSNLTTVEASLTGESLPSVKSSGIIRKSLSLGDRKNMVWMGTYVSSGSAKGLVVGTGANTAIGAIAKDIREIKEEKSHFQKKTDILAMQMGVIAAGGAIIIFIIGFFIRGIEFNEILLFTIATLISSIPEGLPAIIAIVLAVGAFRMSKRNAIIRKLPATETLAVVNTIITDKTGTLTENTMTVVKIALPGEKEIIVDGNGWEPVGGMKQGEKDIVPLEKVNLKKLLHIAGICNNSTLIKEKNEKDHYKIIGDPTEASLTVLAEKSGLKKEVLSQKEIRIDDMPFDQKLRLRASLSNIIKDKKKELYIVGAPEMILEKCSKILRLNTIKNISLIDKNEINSQINGFTDSAMRVLGIAYREVDNEMKKIHEDEIDKMTFVGVVGIIDPPREEVKGAISKAKAAGIRVIMATGDHKNTAIAVAKEIGLDCKSGVMTEIELKELDEREFSKVVSKVNVFARLSPHMKLKIADSLQKKGNVVAMTGDGINDAPALKKADIGISMGEIGTDVARESSDIVLADDNFVSIINAIEEGRIVFTNTRQSSFFLITTNFAEALTILATLSIGLPLPLLPTQILWLNLVTDTSSGLGLAVEPGHNHINSEKPKSAKENILTKEVVPFMVLMSLCMVVLTVLTFVFFLDDGIEIARTGAFIVMATTQLFNSYNMRALKKSVFKIGIFSNKYLNIFLFVSVILMFAVIYIPFFQKVFGFGNIKVYEFLGLIALSSIVLWGGELYKRLKFK